DAPPEQRPARAVAHGVQSWSFGRVTLVGGVDGNGSVDCAVGLLGDVVVTPWMVYVVAELIPPATTTCPFAFTRPVPITVPPPPVQMTVTIAFGTTPVTFMQARMTDRP